MKQNFRLLTQSPERLNVIVSKLGATSAEVFTDVDRGKPVSMGKIGNHTICVDGAEIEGFIDSIDPGPTADGLSVGGVARCNAGTRMEVVISGAADVLDLVVAGVNAGSGVANAAPGLGVAKKGTPATHKWRIISFANDADATTGGDVAVIEKL